MILGRDRSPNIKSSSAIPSFISLLRTQTIPIFPHNFHKEEEDCDPVAIAIPEPPASVREKEVHADDLGEGGVYL